ncbi:MAG: hypothetical protein JNG90_12450 [Planctomycetaceae bacterium]|nr:hypothetical protein [Planctomycetaceae bacterium]
MATGTVPPELPSASHPPRGNSELVEYDRYISAQIQKTRRQVKWVELASALLLLATGVLAYGLLVAIVDSWLIPGGLGVWGRLAAFAVLVTGVGSYVAWRIVPAVRRRVNPVYAAHAIEQGQPSLKNSLVNFLLLRGERARLPIPVYEAIERRAAEDLATVPADTAVDRSPVIRAGYVLLALVTIFCVYSIFSPKSPLRSFRRMLLPWSSVSAPTRVTIGDVQPGGARAFVGESLTVSALVRGLRKDEPVTLYFTTQDGQSVDQPLAMRPPSDSYRHQAILPPAGGLQQSLEYRIAAGDAKAGPFHVQVLATPAILVEKVQYEFPGYTRLAPRTVERQGDLQGIEGTKVTLWAKTNVDVSGGYIDFNCDGSRDLELAFSGRSAQATFELRLDPSRKPLHTSYQLRFLDDQKQLNPQPIRYQIEVLPDQGPEIEITQPGVDNYELPRNGAVTIGVRATDRDFGLRRVTLHFERAGKRLHSVELLEAPTGGDFTGAHVFEPSRLTATPVEVGDVLQYWAESRDSRAPTANHVQTVKYRFKIVDKVDESVRAEQVAAAQQQAAEIEAAGQPPETDQPPPQEATGEAPPGEQPEERGEAEPQTGDEPAADEAGTAADAEQRPDPEQDPAAAMEKILEYQQEKEQQQKEQQQSKPQPPMEQSDQQPEPQPSGDEGESGSGGKSGQKEGGQGKSGSKAAEDSGEAGDEASSGGEEAGDQSGSAGSKNSAGGKSDSGQQAGGQSGAGSDANSAGNDAGGKSPMNASKPSPQNAPGKPDAGQQAGQKPSAEPGAEGGDPDKAPSGAQPGKNSGTKPPGGKQPAGQQPEGESGGNPSQDGQGDAGASAGQEKQPKPGQDEENTGEGHPQPTGDDPQKPQGGAGSKQPGAKQSPTPEPQEANQPRGQNPPPSPDKEQGTSEDASSPSNSPKQSNKVGSEEGDRSGDGNKGGGQKSESPGEGSPGQNTPSDAGSGESSEPGNGESKAGAGNQESDKPTGQPGGQKKGEGSSSKPSQNGKQPGGSGQSAQQPPAGRQPPRGQTGGKQPGGQPSGDPSQGGQQPGTQPGGQQPSGGTQSPAGDTPAAGQDAPGNQPPSSPGSTGAGATPPPQDPGNSQGSISKTTDEMNANDPNGKSTGGGKAGDDANPNQQPFEPAGTQADPLNREHAERATELVLESLAEQMAKRQVDPELLDKLNWSQDDMQKFLQRWQQLKREAAEQGPRGDAARKQLAGAMERLGAARRGLTINSREGRPDDVQRLRESRGTKPPAEYREQFEAYTEGAARRAK